MHHAKKSCVSHMISQIFRPEILKVVPFHSKNIRKVCLPTSQALDII